LYLWSLTIRGGSNRTPSGQYDANGEFILLCII
jgi:hypothetical protein